MGHHHLYSHVGLLEARPGKFFLQGSARREDSGPVEKHTRLLTISVKMRKGSPLLKKGKKQLIY